MRWLEYGFAVMLVCSAPIAVATEQTAAVEELPEAALLAVEVGFFSPDPAIDAEHSETLRRAEARYVPYLLRSTLEGDRRWGPVRVLPAPEAYAELAVQGRIVSSEPGRLELHVVARDATGRVWLDRRYAHSVGLPDYGERGWVEPFRPLYRRLADDLEQARAALSLTELERIIEVSRLRHAATLAPAAYRDYFSVADDGVVTLQRLPAVDDPILARAERVREARYLFVDTVDRRLGQFVGELGPTYTAWRRATLEAQRRMARYRQSGGSRRSLKGVYNDFREAKLYQQTLAEHLEAFAFEIGPTRLELEGELVELTGTLEAQFVQWQELMRRIHAETVGLDGAESDGSG